MRLPTETGVYVMGTVDVDGFPVPVAALIVRPKLVILSTMICPARVAVRDLGMDRVEVRDVMHETVLN